MPGHRHHRPTPPDRDAYREDQKLAGGTRCPDCDLVVRQGRWVRRAEEDPQDGPSHVCPACRRVRDRYPAGVVDLTGDLGDLGPELAQLVRNVEEAESEEHPLERVIELTVTEGSLFASTTGVHLARRVGAALERRLHGQVTITYGEEENLVRVEGSL